MMTYDPNDPVRNPDPSPELVTAPVRRTGSSWIGWVVAAALILVAAFAITQWFDRPGTDPNPTASTIKTEPVKPAVVPAAPAAPSSEPAAPAPANPSTGGTTQP